MSGAVEGVDRAKAMLLGDEDTQGIRPQVTFADHSYPAYSKQQMIDFALLYAASLTTPPARSYADGLAVAAKHLDERAERARVAAIGGGMDPLDAELLDYEYSNAAAAIRLLSQGEKA